MQGNHPTRLNRIQASGIHLVASLTIFFTLLGLLILAWYPGPTFELEGGWTRVRLIAFVALLAGPLLTLVLFRPGRPGLRSGMSLIVLLQVSALAWGVHTLFDARPALLVLADGSFRVISHAQLAAIDPSGRVLDRWAGPSLARVYVDLPDDPGRAARPLTEQPARPGTVHTLYERYEPLQTAWGRAVEDSLDIEHYVAGKDAWRSELDALTKSLGRDASELVFFPYVGRYDRTILVADPGSRRFVGALDIPYDAALARKRVPPRERIGRAHPRGGDPALTIRQAGSP